MDLEEGRTGSRSAEEDTTRSSPDERSGSDLVMLMENAQLKTLALLLRNNEEPLMKQAIKSQREREQYLKSVNDAYDNAVKLLDDSTAMMAMHGKGGARTSIAQDVHDYVKYSLNMCMQNVRNCCLRVDTLGKMRAHYDSLAKDLADPAADVDSLAAEASQYKRSMWEYCYNFRSASARALSRAYSRVLMLEGVAFPELVRRHQLKLGYGKSEFEELGDTDKLEVYNSIIAESGRAQVSFPEVRKGKAVKTWAEAVKVFLMSAGTMVWDIFTTEHNVESVFRSSLNVLAAVGGFAVEVAVTAAVTKAVASVGLGLFACSLAGFVAGAVAGLVFIFVSGSLIDLILGSGGNKAPPVTDLKFHTAIMPDGMAFANSIAHQSSST